LPRAGVDWDGFIDPRFRSLTATTSKTTRWPIRRLQFAYRIDPSLVNPLHSLAVPPLRVGSAIPAAAEHLNDGGFWIAVGPIVAKRCKSLHCMTPDR